MKYLGHLALIVLVLSSILIPSAAVVSAADSDADLLAQLGGPVQAASMRGRYAYMGMGPRIAVIDISRPGQPLLVGRSAPLPGVALDIALGAGEPPAYVYVAAGRAGLFVLDVADPTRPQLVGRYDSAGEATDLAVAGHLVYLADWQGGLCILNVADPTQPQRIGQFSTGRLARSVAVDEGYAYIADSSIFGGGDALKIIDVRTPSAPILMASFAIASGQARGLAARGNIVYVANGEGLATIDVTTRTQPKLAGACTLSGFAVDVALVGEHAFVASWDGGLHAINIADPANPTRVGTLDTEGNALKIAAEGGVACVADQKALRLVDISTPAALRDPAGPRELGALRMTGATRGITLADNRAYIAESPRWDVDRWVGGGLRILDISNAASITEIGAYQTDGVARDVAVAGDYAFIAHEEQGLRILRIADPRAPVQVGALDTPGSAVAVKVAGNLAYVADTTGGLRVINVAVPSAPVEIGYFVGGTPFYDVALVGNRAYVAAGNGGLRILDIANPTQPRELGVCAVDGWAWAVAVVGNRAYIAAGNSGLCIANIKHPTQAVALSYYAMEEALDVAVQGNYAYVTDAPAWDGEAFVGGGLRILNIADDLAPYEASFFDTPGSPGQVALAGTIAYVADGASGLRALDVTYPETPAQIAPPLPGLARRVALAGNYAYVADQEQGLRILDIRNRSRPQEIHHYRAWAMDVAIDGALAFVVDRGGLHALLISDPAHPLPLSYHPAIGQATAVKVASGHVFLAESSVRQGMDTVGGGVHILQLEAELGEVSFVSMPKVEGLAVSGSRLYLAGGSDGLRIFGISDPQNPTLLGGFNVTPAYDVAVSGNLAYLADGDGLTIVNIASPQDPVLVGRYAASGNSWSLCLSESLVARPYAYLADGAGGLHVVNVAAPDKPLRTALIKTAGKALGVATLNGLVYIADEAGGLAVLMPFPQRNVLPLLLNQRR